MKRWMLRTGTVLLGVLLLNTAWNVAGSIAITPNSPAPVVATAVSGPCDAPGAVCGTIRWVSAASWAAIEDAGHHATGIASVEVFADHLRVNYGFAALSVAAMQVSPDEAFAAAGVRVGASVGLAYADLYFYMGASSVPVNPALLTKAGANVWITGWMDVAAVTP